MPDIKCDKSKGLFHSKCPQNSRIFDKMACTAWNFGKEAPAIHPRLTYKVFFVSFCQNLVFRAENGPKMQIFQTKKNATWSFEMSNFNGKQQQKFKYYVSTSQPDQI